MRFGEAEKLDQHGKAWRPVSFDLFAFAASDTVLAAILFDCSQDAFAVLVHGVGIRDFVDVEKTECSHRILLN